jgi:hypothetical protein
MGCEEPEIRSDPVITAEPENGNPTPWIIILTPVLLPLTLKPVTSAEPLILMKGTLELTNIPSWYISIVPVPPLPPLGLYTPNGT